MMPVEGDLVARAMSACKEVLEMEPVPEVDSSGNVVLLESEEFVKKGKKLKQLGDNKVGQARVASVRGSFHVLSSAGQGRYTQQARGGD